LVHKYNGKDEILELKDDETFFGHVAQIMHDSAIESDNVQWEETSELMPLPFYGGLVGYFGYEMKSESLKFSNLQPDFLTRNANHIPDASFIFADRVVVYDHELSKIHLVYLVDQLDSCDRKKLLQQQWCDDIKLKISKLFTQKIESKAVYDIDLKNEHSAKINSNRENYLDMVNASLIKINDGETYEVCLTNQLKYRLIKPHPSPLTMYMDLRKRNPAPHAAFLSLGNDLKVVSSSPERFIKIDKDRAISMKPIKGTMQAATAMNFIDDDAAILNENIRRREILASNEKDRSENLMVIY
jgi:para-aminobenzoate synthetase